MNTLHPTRLPAPLLGTDNVPSNVLVDTQYTRVLHSNTLMSTIEGMQNKQTNKNQGGGGVSNTYAPEEEPSCKKHAVRLHLYHRTAGTEAFKGC